MYTASDIEWMKRTKRVKLSRRETLNHYIFVALVGLVPLFLVYDFIRIAFGTYDGKREPEEMLPTFFISVIITLTAFFYTRNKLQFKTITVEHDADHFQDAVRRTVKQLNWSLESVNSHFVRAYRHDDLVAPPILVHYKTIGEMITILRDGNTLYLNSVYSPKLRANIFAFRQNRINLRQFLINLQEAILNVPPNDDFVKQEEEKAQGGRFVRVLATVFSVVMVLEGIFIVFIEPTGVFISAMLIGIGAWYLYTESNLKKEQQRLDKQNKKTLKTPDVRIKKTTVSRLKRCR